MTAETGTNPMGLVDEFARALRESRNTANNAYLQLLHPSVKSLESAAMTDSVLEEYVNRLREIVTRSGFPLRGDYTNEFAQVFGEAHFYLMCAYKGIHLKRVPETQESKTPDFICEINAMTLHFEVKTLSVVDGAYGINKDLMSSLHATIDIQRQLASGQKIAFGEAELSPYGGKSYRKGVVTAATETLIDKMLQNIKPDQFSNSNTFLVVNLCLIRPLCTDNRAIRPAYCDEYFYIKPVTGQLWMAAFAKPGMLVHTTPEFEGKPSVEGVLSKNGVLIDSMGERIAGLLFVVYPLGNEPEIWGVFRSRDYFDTWQNTAHDLIKALHKITGNNWNDDLDSNGWQLQGRVPKSRPWQSVVSWLIALNRCCGLTKYGR